jgi:hypothetical protein
MRKRTLNEYELMIERYSDIDINNPLEAYNKLKKKGLKLGYIKNVLCAYKWKTNNEEYSKLIKDIIQEINKNEVKYTNKFVKLDWGKIQKYKYDNKYTVNDVIMGLYTLFPPRRITDYAYMIYTNGPVNDDNVNYCDMNGKIFIFRNYKTIRKYGEQIFEIPPKLYNIINEYVKKNDLHDGDVLLKYKNNENKFNEQMLMRRIKKIFGTSVDGLRHSYITYLYKDTSKLFDIEDTSLKMAHDIKTHLRYLDKENKSTL